MTDTFEQSKDIILDDMAQNKTHYLFISEPLRRAKEQLQQTEDSLWQEDIDDGFKIALTELFAENMHHRLNISIEDALCVLVDINLKEYVKC